MEAEISVSVTLFVIVLKVSFSHICEPCFFFNLLNTRTLLQTFIHINAISSIYP